MVYITIQKLLRLKNVSYKELESGKRREVNKFDKLYKTGEELIFAVQLKLFI